MRSRGRGILRIVAGEKRGHQLRVPRSSVLRPTSEKVREAVFDVLGPVDSARVLDLFAGSGALGLEALSRGAAACVFVEKDTRVAAVLKDNISRLGYEGIAQVLVCDYRTGLERLRAEQAVFDLLFIDPPYRMLPEVQKVLGPLLPKVLTSDGVAVFEGPRSFVMDVGEAKIFERTYGDTRITMITLRRNNQ